MIKSFKHKGLEQFFTKEGKRLLDAKDLPKITRILDRLDAAVVVKDMDIPGWDFHELKGNRKGVWSVAVRKNWKITFCFEDSGVYEVNLEDYH
ncbi:MAG TPA: type II toxin-antitoxin system RelE/ParE family toxin [Gammaproteobacteria bacterium]|nr:type II toxin-antitoxin system RelE/ParE family toxin [Gammaproteobacteria bacterium]